MAVTCLGSVRLNSKIVIQTIDTSTDTVYFKVDNKVLLTIDSMGYATKTGQEKCIGKFSLTANGWKFCLFNENFDSMNACDSIHTKTFYLIGAEMYVVKDLIKRNVLEV